MSRLVLVLVAVVVLVLVAGVSAEGRTQHASATVENVSGEVIGVARFTEDATGRVHVSVHVKGISPGLHGIHLHTVGSCNGSTTPAFSSAGGHFNPANQQHGLENPAGHHAGDLPNLKVNKAGVGHLSTTTDHISLSNGQLSLFDGDRTALIIHANPDDQVTDPTGNSGGRIACGVIERD